MASAAVCALAATRRHASTSREALTSGAVLGLIGDADLLLLPRDDDGLRGLRAPPGPSLARLRSPFPPVLFLALYFSITTTTPSACSLLALASSDAPGPWCLLCPERAAAFLARPKTCSPRALTAPTSAPPRRQASTVSLWASFLTNRCSNVYRLRRPCTGPQTAPPNLRTSPQSRAIVPAVSSGFPPRIFLSAICCAHK